MTKWIAQDSQKNLDKLIDLAWNFVLILVLTGFVAKFF